MCIPLSLLGNSSVNMFPRQRIHAIEELLDALFSIRSVSYPTRVCVPPILVNVPPKHWSEGSHSCQTVKYGHESCGTQNKESLCWRRSAAIYLTGLCIPILSLGNGLVNTFPRQGIIVGGVVFYAVRVVSKESG
jgi:hypothetical protein